MISKNDGKAVGQMRSIGSMKSLEHRYKREKNLALEEHPHVPSSQFIAFKLDGEDAAGQCWGPQHRRSTWKRLISVLRKDLKQTKLRMAVVLLNQAFNDYSNSPWGRV
jgi:hypothetical protein